MVIAQFIQQKNDQVGNQKHIINFSWLYNRLDTIKE